MRGEQIRISLERFNTLARLCENGMNEFELLDCRLREELKKRGITEPTEPQSRAIPAILFGEHVLLVAPTGIGKTEAAMLPVLHKLAGSKRRGQMRLRHTAQGAEQRPPEEAEGIRGGC